MTFPIQVYQITESANDSQNPGGVKVGQVTNPTHLPGWLEAMGLSDRRHTLVVVGGASGMDADQQMQLETLFRQVLAPLAEEMQLYVVDGGTDAGVMRLMGQARTAIGGTFPLVGVAPRSLVSLPDQPIDHPEASILEPHHTHCLLVPGDKWGDESVWIAEVATLLSDSHQSLTILINGGSVTVQDAYASIDAGREIVIIAGTGRTADDIVEALTYQVCGNKVVAHPRIAGLLDVSEELLTAIDLDNHPDLFRQDLKQLLLG
ncbi:hypothetical protein [Leptolyngbya sp. PCC 6406]|uniref:hypothetical protein n=1 Tax=Leptolyngbya sp. PCC 6406 TaxID=1173264 RepID=UPI0002ABEE2B|nr:hypothetical protein [Leptolyngbya sp. PCC 6406]